jgi:SAM-dependent methyltransferase
VVDPVLEVDWAAQWRALVEAREVEAGGGQLGNFWDLSAKRFARSARCPQGAYQQLVTFLEPWLLPSRTLLDVGAGVGRYAVPLASRLDWVTAVEPSQGMREQIPPLDNLTIIASNWEDAEPAPADLVICVNVLYGIADPVPFIEKLAAHARERVFLVLRDRPVPHPAQLLAPSRVREPGVRDCYLLLRHIGVAPDVTMLRHPASFGFESMEAAVEDCRLRLGSLWDESTGRLLLETALQPQEDGTLRYEAGEMTTGVLHWKPTS